jgi:hypothetical protein
MPSQEHTKEQMKTGRNRHHHQVPGSRLCCVARKKTAPMSLPCLRPAALPPFARPLSRPFNPTTNTTTPPPPAAPAEPTVHPSPFLSPDGEVDLAAAVLHHKASNEALVDDGLELDVLAASQLLKLLGNQELLLLLQLDSAAQGGDLFVLGGRQAGMQAGRQAGRETCASAGLWLDAAAVGGVLLLVRCHRPHCNYCHQTKSPTAAIKLEP